MDEVTDSSFEQDVRNQLLEEKLATLITGSAAVSDPEVRQAGPGACPKCGMALEPRTITAEDDENPELKDMTLGDLLLENRIVFLGSSPEAGGQSAITDYLANVTIQKLLYLQCRRRVRHGQETIANCQPGFR